MNMDYENKPLDYYQNPRPEMLEFLPSKATKVLDVGCSNGAFGLSIKEKNNAEVWGIEPMKNIANQASSVLDKVLINSCENVIGQLPDNYFDAIFFNDVLEHMINPNEVLLNIKSKLNENGKIISSIPNIRYHNNFIRLIVNKDWKYEEFGVMDKTHLRFFTGKTIQRMYNEAGYKLEFHKGIKKSKSIKPILYNIFALFTALDIRYMQYATIASVKK